jgi:hypothetical protein
MNQPRRCRYCGRVLTVCDEDPCPYIADDE